MNLPVDYEADIKLGVGALQITNDRNRGVGCVVDAEYKLNRAGVVLFAEARQILTQARLRAM